MLRSCGLLNCFGYWSSSKPCRERNMKRQLVLSSNNWLKICSFAFAQGFAVLLVPIIQYHDWYCQHQLTYWSQKSARSKRQHYTTGLLVPWRVIVFLRKMVCPCGAAAYKIGKEQYPVFIYSAAIIHHFARNISSKLAQKWRKHKNALKETAISPTLGISKK